MKKLLYIGHAYHNKTKSTAFLKEMFAKYYDVETFDFDPYKDDMSKHFLPLKGKKYDVVVIFQIMPELDKLKKYIKFKHCAFFPMYDGVPPRDNSIWYQYRNVNIINFSKTLHDELKLLGFSSFYFQFFPKPIEITDQGDEKSIFFWQRINAININTLEKLIDFKGIKHIHFHHAIDPKHTFVEPSDKIAKKATHSTWFETREDMQKQMQKSAVYIAPRAFEGIGMSFLEAMSMGRCVIAPNNPTMNEYIVNGENGILYDLNNPMPIDLSDIRGIQKRTEKFIKDGYEKWESEKWKIIDVLTHKPVINKSKLNNKYLQKPDFDNLYNLFGILPIMRIVGHNWHKAYKLFGFLPFLLIKGNDFRRRVYVFGLPVLRIKGNKPEIKPGPVNNMPAEVTMNLQKTPNPKGRVLMVFHMNFLRKDQGCSNYIYETAMLLKKMGYAIDFFSADLFSFNAFGDLAELNKREKLIDNFYFANYKNSTKYETSWDVHASDINWVNDFTRRFFEKIVTQNKYDYIDIHYIQWANLLLNRKKLFPDTVAVYHCQDSNFMQKFLNTVADLPTTANIVANAFASEYKSYGLFDKFMCISYDEMLFWQKFFQNKEFYFMPHPLNAIRYDNKKHKDIDVLFLAAYNPYNLHGLQWFVDEVCPHLSKNIKITVCGRIVQFLKTNNPEYIDKMKNLGFNLIDYANNLEDLYSKTKIAMVPLYEGTGMKIKTIEAMSHNIPIVSRSAGVDGFPDKTNNGILVTDDPHQFAKYLEKLYTDKKFYNNIKDREYEYFQTHFSKTNVQDLMKRVFVVNK